jgi:hypothetical protein
VPRPGIDRPAVFEHLDETRDLFLPSRRGLHAERAKGRLDASAWAPGTSRRRPRVQAAVVADVLVRLTWVRDRPSTPRRQRSRPIGLRTAMAGRMARRLLAHEKGFGTCKHSSRLRFVESSPNFLRSKAV